MFIARSFGLPKMPPTGAGEPVALDEVDAARVVDDTDARRCSRSTRRSARSICSMRFGVVSVFIISTNTTRIFRYSVNTSRTPPGQIENGAVSENDRAEQRSGPWFPA